MDTEDKLIHKREVLILECKQLHDNIQRCMSDMYKLLALGFPILTSGFALTLKSGQGLGIESGTLHSLFALILGVLAVSFNSAWLQLLNFVKYKYAEVLPRLYDASYVTGENFGQYTIGQGALRTFSGVAITQLLLLPTAVASILAAIDQSNSSIFLVPAIITILLAAFSTVYGWFAASDAVNCINNSKPEVELKE
ncbi:MAG: hypothetical protein HRU20_23910 [Pseudomonadales bacterium]|nr:hypothetical protein [Pseudomonadales bacterium]